jgi:nickel superoxide dismutase
MKKIQHLLLGLFVGMILTIGGQEKTYAHCEIPCGIYADSVRIVLMSEHITTIQKSMMKIEELSKAEKVDYNQLVRWVNNKEEHAKKIQDIATQYFMFQRVKPSDDPQIKEKNQKLLGVLHQICVYAMKAKQSTDQQYTQLLKSSVDKLSHLYFGTHKH